MPPDRGAAEWANDPAFPDRVLAWGADRTNFGPVMTVSAAGYCPSTEGAVLNGGDLEFRVLGSGDVGHMGSLLSVFGRAFDDPDTYDSARPEAGYLAGLLANPWFIAVAALFDGIVVGGLAAYVLPKFEQARSEVYIYDLAVDAPYRRRGVATGLINALQVAASDRGAWVIYVQADRGDDPAVALYSRFGTAEDVLHFDIPVRLARTRLPSPKGMQ